MSKKSTKKEEIKVVLTFPTKKARTEFMKKVEEEILKYASVVEELDSLTEDTESNSIPEECNGCDHFSHCWEDCNGYEEDEEEEEETNSIEEETVNALEEAEGVVSDAASILCLDPSTIYKRIKKYGLNLDDYRN